MDETIHVLALVLLLFGWSGTIAVADDVPNDGGKPKKDGQTKYTFVGGAANANKWFEYTECNPDFPADKQKEKRMAQLDANGMACVWVGKTTTLKKKKTAMPELGTETMRELCTDRPEGSGVAICDTSHLCRSEGDKGGDKGVKETKGSELTRRFSMPCPACGIANRLVCIRSGC